MPVTKEQPPVGNQWGRKPISIVHTSTEGLPTTHPGHLPGIGGIHPNKKATNSKSFLDSCCFTLRKSNTSYKTLNLYNKQNQYIFMSVTKDFFDFQRIKTTLFISISECCYFCYNVIETHVNQEKTLHACNNS